MYKELAKKYIHLLQIEHIQKIAHQEGIALTDEEAHILYEFIQANYLNLLEDDTTILQLKNLIHEDLYQKVLRFYQEKKAKYC